MNFLNPFSTERRQNFKPFLQLNQFSNLFIIPYVRNRLNFAQLVVETLEKENIELVLIDLPPFIGNRDWINMAIADFPLIQTLYLNQGSNYFYYTYSPSDAAFIGMVWAVLHQTEYICIDDPDLLQYPKNSLFTLNFALKDDQFIFSEGIREYFKEVWENMYILWWLDQRTNKFLSMQRASLIARTLLEYAKSSRKILFICEYRLWWLINNILINKFDFLETNKEMFSKKRILGTFIIELPALLWIKGTLDDFPYLTFLFYDNLIHYKPGFKDKLKQLDQIVSDFFSELINDKSSDISIRRLITFKRYLNNFLKINRRLIPLPATHLLHATEACFNHRIAQKLAKKLLSFSSGLDFYYGENDYFYKIYPDKFYTTKKGFPLPDLFKTDSLMEYLSQNGSNNLTSESLKDRQYWIDQIQNYLAPTERKWLRIDNNFHTWATTFDKRFRYSTVEFLKKYFNKRSYAYHKTVSYGSIKDGIEWKATLANFSKGSDSIIVKERTIKNLQKWPEYCPIVFIFSERDADENFRHCHEGNITSKLKALGVNLLNNSKLPESDEIITVFRSIKKMQYVVNNHIRIELLSAIGVLFTSPYVWIMRYNELIKRNPRYLCRVMYYDDNELSSFEGHDAIIAWAIKYAENVVSIFAYQNWKPSSKIIEFANQRQVKLRINPLTILPPNYIERLKINFYISSELKKDPHGEEIVKRYIRKMGFRI